MVAADMVAEDMVAAAITTPAAAMRIPAGHTTAAIIIRITAARCITPIEEGCTRLTDSIGPIMATASLVRAIRSDGAEWVMVSAASVSAASVLAGTDSAGTGCIAPITTAVAVC